MINSVMIDWLSFSVKYMDPKEVITNILLMKTENFAFENYSFQKGYTQNYSCAQISVHFNNKGTDDKNGIFVQMMGKGCRQYEEYMSGNENNWVDLIERALVEKANFTRIDVCNDVYNNESMTVSRINRYCESGLCITRSKYAMYQKKYQTEDGNLVGELVSIGKKGNQQLCFYNKLLERINAGEDVPDVSSWLRVEFRVWGAKSQKLALSISSAKPLEEIFFSVLNNYYRFVVPDNKAKDSNKRRRKTVQWWQEYIETVEKTVLSIKRKKVTLTESKKYIELKQSKTLAKIYLAQLSASGEEIANEYIDDLLRKGMKKLSPTDYAEINQYVLEKHNSHEWGSLPREYHKR